MRGCRGASFNAKVSYPIPAAAHSMPTKHRTEVESVLAEGLAVN